MWNKIVVTTLKSILMLESQKMAWINQPVTIMEKEIRFFFHDRHSQKPALEMILK